MPWNVHVHPYKAANPVLLVTRRMDLEEGQNSRSGGRRKTSLKMTLNLMMMRKKNRRKEEDERGEDMRARAQAQLGDLLYFFASKIK
jgi:hypothetical protein